MDEKNLPKLLFLCQVLPSPPSGGVYIRSHNILAILSREYQINAICFFRRGQHTDDVIIADAIADLQKYADVEVFPIPQEWSRLRYAYDHLRSLLMRKAYTVFAYKAQVVENRIRELLLTERFDLIHLDSLDMAAYFPLFDLHTVACTHHNVESALLRRRAGREQSSLRSAYVRLQARLMEQLERTLAPLMAVNIMVSENDAIAMRTLVPDARVEVVTNGVDVGFFKPAILEDSGEIVFVGGLNWFPNLDGLEYFAQEILPILRAKGVNAPIRWIGIATPALIAQYAKVGIELTGFVDDIRPFVTKAACVVVPLRVGGGTRLKVLDAWALGKAMVSTSIGAEGLQTHNGVNILLRDTPQSFADGIEEVLTDRELRARLERCGRATVEDFYSWESIGDKLLGIYRGLRP